MKRLFFQLIIPSLLTTTAVCQQVTYPYPESSNRNQSFYSEFGGNGLMVSANVEYLFPFEADERKAVFLRSGVGFFDADVLVPLELGFLYGRKHGFEFSMGATILFYTDYPSTYLNVFRIGYRYNNNRGFILRVAPLFTLEEDAQLKPYFGVAVGFTI